MNTGAVIVAAGMSSRMGDFKPLLKIGLLSMVDHIIGTFEKAGVSPLVVVTGHRAHELESHLDRPGITCIRNHDYGNTKMFDSARIGFAWIGDKCERTFFTPVDIPLFTPPTLKALSASRGEIVKPVCQGRDGHPLLLSCGLLPEILSSSGEGGLKRIIQGYGDRVERIEVDDQGILWDADTPEEFNRILKIYNQ